MIRAHPAIQCANTTAAVVQFLMIIIWSSFLWHKDDVPIVHCAPVTTLTNITEARNVTIAGHLTTVNVTSLVNVTSVDCCSPYITPMVIGSGFVFVVATYGAMGAFSIVDPNQTDDTRIFSVLGQLLCIFISYTCLFNWARTAPEIIPPPVNFLMFISMLLSTVLILINSAVPLFVKRLPRICANTPLWKEETIEV